MSTVLASPILVVSASWQTRALLAAQLGEQCHREVVSTPGPDGVLELIRVMGIRPALLIVDAHQRMGDEDVKRLVSALPDTPLLLTVSALRVEVFESLRDRCAAYLTRPVSIGRIARVAAQILESRDV